MSNLVASLSCCLISSSEFVSVVTLQVIKDAKALSEQGRDRAALSCGTKARLESFLGMSDCPSPHAVKEAGAP